MQFKLIDMNSEGHIKKKCRYESETSGILFLLVQISVGVKHFISQQMVFFNHWKSSLSCILSIKAAFEYNWHHRLLVVYAYIIIFLIDFFSFFIESLTF